MTQKKVPRPKLLIHSNAPWSSTGYGQQTGLFAPILAERYDVAISSFYGLEGGPLTWEGIPVLPGITGEYGNNSLLPHAANYFGGDPRNGLVMTLMDVWVLDPHVVRNMNTVCWTPVDHRPAPPKVIEFFVQSDAVPLAMSRFGERELGRLDPLYCPHGIDTDTYCPMDQREARGDAFPDGAFVVGMVAANKGRPSRKGFAQALTAFGELMRHHPDRPIFLYLHTTVEPNYGMGEDLRALAEHLDIPFDRIRVASPYKMMFDPYRQQEMRRIYAAMDVLLNPAWGEGFGIPVIEAQACGVPAIVTDFSAMTETCQAGWRVGHRPFWSPQGAWQAIPDTDAIVAALEECYALGDTHRARLAREARAHGLTYDVRTVARQHMLPALRIAAQRFASRQPVRIPSRLKAAA